MIMLLAPIFVIIGCIWFVLGSNDGGITSLLSDSPGGNTIGLPFGNKNENGKAKILDKKPIDNQNNTKSEQIITDKLNTLQTLMDDIASRSKEIGDDMGEGMANGIKRGLKEGGVQTTSIGFQDNNMVGVSNFDRRELKQPILTMGMKFTRPADMPLIQHANKIINQSSGKQTISQQGKEIKNMVSNGGNIKLEPNTNAGSYISGNIGGIIADKVGVQTDNFQIKGVSRAYQLMDAKFTAPKGTLAEMESMKEIVKPLLYAKSIRANNNTPQVEKRKISHVMDMQEKEYFESPEQTLDMIERKIIYLDEANKNLSGKEKRKLYQLNNLLKSTGNQDKYAPELLREIVQASPNMEVVQMMQIAEIATNLQKGRERRKQNIAANDTNKEMNLEEENRLALNNIFGASSKAAKYMQSHYGSEINRLSKAEIMSIEQRAHERVEAMGDLSEEQRQIEFNNEKQRLIDETKNRKLEEVGDILKEQIMLDPDSAGEIIGESGIEQFKKEILKNENKRNAIYYQKLTDNERTLNSEYQLKNPEIQVDVSTSRKNYELREDISMATRMLHSGYKDTHNTLVGDNKYEDSLVKEIIKIVPDLDNETMANIVKEVKKLEKERERRNYRYAQDMTNRQINLGNENANVVNDLLKGTSVAGNNFHTYIQEKFGEKIKDIDMSEIAEQAKRNVQEEASDEYKKEMERLVKEKQDANFEEIEEFLKQQIIDDPTRAEAIIGKEGMEALQKAFLHNQKRRDSIYNQMLMRRELALNSEYRNQHPEITGSVYDERRRNEMREDIMKVTGMLYLNQQGETDAISVNRPIRMIDDIAI